MTRRSDGGTQAGVVPKGPASTDRGKRRAERRRNAALSSVPEGLRSRSQHERGLQGETPEAVDHPAHYGGDSAYEAIRVIEAWRLGFCLGNAVKYIARAGKKDPSALVEDLKKARWYLNREIENLEVGS